jgi:nitrogen-specific signal transduction histidine kinase
MHSYAPYQARSSVRRRSITFDGLQPAVALNAYVAALDVTTEAVMIIDRASIVLYANAAAEALFGAGSLVGRRLLSLYPLERRALRSILSELQKKGVWRSNLRPQTGSAQPELEVALRTVALTPGRPQHFCLVAHAKHESRESRESHVPREPREQPDRNASDATLLSTVGRVAGEIAHDFNNQIAVVINYSFILLRQLPDDSPLREHVAEMQSAAWRASQVAQEMLGFSGQRSDEAVEIDVNALLADVQALFTHALPEDTRLEQHLAENLWRVRARRAHLEWLLVELAGRMRSTMGPIESFCITTCNSDAVSDGSQTEHARSVLISVEARPAPANGPQGGHAVVTPLKALAPTPLPNADTTGLRGTELALAHAQGELTVQQLPDGGLRYRIRLPAM